MKTALLHYWLTNLRGGEKVVSALRELLPEADVFTHAYRPFAGSGLEGARIKESFIGHLPFARRHPERYLPRMPWATRMLNLSDYELIVSSESGPIKGIRKRPDQRHLCYCHTPMRYVWDLFDEYRRMTSSPNRLVMSATVAYLRAMDLRSAENVDEFVANSRFVADRIKRIYGRDALVVHPPVDVDFFSAPISEGARRSVGDKPYYLFVGASVQYKRYDLAAAACRRMGRKLVFVGGGNKSDEELRVLYAGAQALLFPGIEDFGMVAVEAQAAGTPVIAYRAGGALETVREGETGLFFGTSSVESLCNAMEECEGRKWDPEKCRANANCFSRPAFFSKMRAVLEGDSRPPATKFDSLRILVATHKPYRMPEGEAFLPIHAGSAGKPDLGYARDDTGENISSKNANYCELTALYWAWKNLKCDYLGLVHYRRLFAVDVAHVKRLLKTTGIILPQKRYYVLESNYSHYVHAHHAADIDLARTIIAERHPQYLDSFDTVMRWRTGHRFNMFVMRKDFADDYCRWLFDILFELEQRLDISSYSTYDARVFGFVSERLLDVWLHYHRLSHRDVPIRNLEDQHWVSKVFSFLMRKYNYRFRHRS